MDKQTKTIEDYPEKWLSTLCKERTGMSLEKFKQEYYCDFTPEKMVISTAEFESMRNRIDELTERLKSADLEMGTAETEINILEEENTKLTEQNKELQERCVSYELDTYAENNLEQLKSQLNKESK